MLGARLRLGDDTEVVCLKHFAPRVTSSPKIPPVALIPADLTQPTTEALL